MMSEKEECLFKRRKELIAMSAGTHKYSVPRRRVHHGDITKELNDIWDELLTLGWSFDIVKGFYK